MMCLMSQVAKQMMSNMVVARGDANYNWVTQMVQVYIKR